MNLSTNTPLREDAFAIDDKTKIELPQKQLEEFIESLKNIAVIQLVKEVSTDSIKSINNLIFD